MSTEPMEVLQLRALEQRAQLHKTAADLRGLSREAACARLLIASSARRFNIRADNLRCVRL
jgi:hypothetical protein